MSLTGTPSTRIAGSTPWTGEMKRTDQPEPILRISEIAPLSFTGIAVLIMVLPGIDKEADRIKKEGALR